MRGKRPWIMWLWAGSFVAVLGGCNSILGLNDFTVDGSDQTLDASSESNQPADDGSTEDLGPAPTTEPSTAEATAGADGADPASEHDDPAPPAEQPSPDSCGAHSPRIEPQNLATRVN